jgi:hypothetical protein
VPLEVAAHKKRQYVLNAGHTIVDLFRASFQHHTVYAVKMSSLVSGIMLDPWGFELYGQFAIGTVAYLLRLLLSNGSINKSQQRDCFL